MKLSLPKIHFMKIQNMMLALIGAGILTGCGVSQSEHQRVENELQQTKQKSADASTELETGKQKVASLTTSLAEQEKTIQALNDSVKAAEASNAAKDAQIDRLMNLEESAFADAQAADKAGDNTKTLTTYKAFVRDFPFSSKIAVAQARINEVEQLFRNQANEKTSQQRAAANAAALQAQEDADKNQRETFANGIMNQMDLSSLLTGKTQARVISLLGKPDKVDAYRWHYFGKARSSSLGSSNTDFQIEFTGGVVSYCGVYDGAGQLAN